MDTPIFIIGNPRSGTSLLRLMLSSHSSIVIAPECGFLQWWNSKYNFWSFEDSSDLSRVDEFLSDLTTSKKIETWGLNFQDLRDRIILSKPTSYSELCASVYLQFATQFKADHIQYWGDKNNYYINYLELLYRLFPNAYFVIIMRDGRDVACSYRALSDIEPGHQYKPNLPLSIDRIATDWLENNYKILDFFRNNNDSQRIIIKYEDLVNDTQTTLKNVCAFLNLEYEDKMENYYKNSNGIKEPKEVIAWKRKTLEKPDPSNIGKFKHILCKEDIQKFNFLAIRLLKELEYE